MNWIERQLLKERREYEAMYQPPREEILTILREGLLDNLELLPPDSYLWVTSPNPEECARIIDDARLDRAITETRAMIDRCDERASATRWVHSCVASYTWTCAYHYFLSQEWLFRFEFVHPDRLFMPGPGKWEWPGWGRYNAATDQHHRLDYRHLGEDGAKFLLRMVWELGTPKWTKRPKPDFSLYDNKRLFAGIALHQIIDSVPSGWIRKKGWFRGQTPYKGMILCPRCGDDLTWHCVGRKNEVHFNCDDCISWKGGIL